MKKIMKLSKILLLCTISIVIINSTFLSEKIYCQERIITITSKANGSGQFENIQYRTINESEIVDFNKLVRIYINKSSIVLVDMEVLPFDSTGSAVGKILEESIKSKYGDLNSNTVINPENKLSLLIKKSIYTSKDDFKLIMEMLNKTIWRLQNYYSNELYSANYDLLTQQQKDNINKLVPLQNYLAKDNEY
ncbi:MAG: hypothetical protein QM503_11760 [Bacteroidota bacterium]